MDKKILLQEIADIIAEKEGITKKKADLFTRAFFDIIEEGLMEDKFVKVKGFGTFKVIPVSERESVDINTGERIQISGHSKITFTPDNYLKDLVNKPFAHFQTVVINEETDIDELESIPTPEEEPDDAEEETAEVKNETPATKADIAPTEEIQTLPEAETGEPVADETTGEEQPTEAEEISATATLDETEPEEEDTPEVADAPLEDETSTPAEEEPTAETEEENPSGAVPADEDTPSTPQPEAADETDKTENSSQGNIQYIIKEVPPRKEKNRWKLMAFTLFILFMMGISYFAGYFRVFCPCDVLVPAKTAPKATAPAVVAPTTSATNAAQRLQPQDTTRVAEPVAPVVAPKDTVPAKPQAAPKTVQEKTYVVAKGDNVYIIAKKIYGHKKYATDIIKHNHLKNPDNIVIGSTLKLPDLNTGQE